MSLSRHTTERARSACGCCPGIPRSHGEALHPWLPAVFASLALSRFCDRPGCMALLAIRPASPVRSLATLRGGRYL